MANDYPKDLHAGAGAHKARHHNAACIKRGVTRESTRLFIPVDNSDLVDVGEWSCNGYGWKEENLTSSKMSLLMKSDHMGARYDRFTEMFQNVFSINVNFSFWISMASFYGLN